MSRRYWLITRLSTAPIGLLLCYLFGLRGILLLAVWAGSTPIVGGLLVIPMSLRLFPPTLERYLPSIGFGLDAK